MRIRVELDLDLAVEPSDREILVRAKLELLETVPNVIVDPITPSLKAELPQQIPNLEQFR